LEPSRPAYTVTGSGGGGTHVYHWKEPRALTNREKARLQTFPDTFVFSGKKDSVRKQVGMAVPPIAAKHIFQAILRTYAGVPYPHVDPNIKIKNVNV
jgi:DNA (cytosine-5)-methyltransferase 1